MFPLKSGIKVSIVTPGEISLTAFTVAAQIAAPPSFSSSRFTDVITACFTPINLMAFATRSGSSQSSSVGNPVCTAQKPQERVHTFPKIMNVAVPAPQHSPMFGQFPLSQIVCNLCSLTIFLTFKYSSPVGSFTLNQSGFLILVLTEFVDSD